MPTLTKKQKQVFDFVDLYHATNGIGPTLEEIRKNLRVKAISTVHQHVESLKSKGYLSGLSNFSRTLAPTQSIRIIVDIPIVGTIRAGYPLEAFELVEGHISIVNPAITTSEGHYALRVDGDSMIDEGIFHGDIVVIKKQSTAENGQTVVAIVDDNQATLKRLYREKGKFRLQPRNPRIQPLFRIDVEIRGVVVQVISSENFNRETSTQPISRLRFRTIDLFAGVGGIRLGFEKAGFKTVFANDFEPKCKDTYDLNFRRSKLIVEDIRKIDINDLPEFDFLLGGFPCQAFSIAGYRQGFSDLKGRGNLFFDVARIIEAKKPEGFMLENVKNLKTHDNGRTFKIIEKTLIDLGYHIRAKVLNTKDYGNIPQNRERIYIVGFKNKAFSDRFVFPEPKKLEVKITDLLERTVPEKYYYNGKPLFDKLKDFVKEKGQVYQWRRQYVRENKRGVCPTLTANMGTGGHNVPIIKDHKGIRKLMPIECFRIQGFPTDYKLPLISDSALYKQAGNSVSVPVVEAVARQMMRAME